MLDVTHINALKALVSPNSALTDDQDIDPYTQDWRGRFKGATPLVLLPKTTMEVSSIVRYCNSHEIAIVPQGGNTGLVRGGIPDETGDQIIINLSRMNKIFAIDTANRSVKVETGAILQNIQDAAKKEGLLYPISLGAEGSCQIGGNISTNAGGIHVLKYGMTRDQVLGLEAVLPDGSIYSGLTALRKDNTGFNLDQLLVGAEGTLGIVTAAVLKLQPLPTNQQTIFFGIKSPEKALHLLQVSQSTFGNALAAFEIFSNEGFQHVLHHIVRTKNPFEQIHDWYVLADIWSHGTETNPAIIETFFEELLAKTVIDDAVLAPSLNASKEFWRIRETFAEALKEEGSRYAFDVSVSVSSIPEFIQKASAALAQILPGCEGIAFGHAGDGNIHFNLVPTKKVSAVDIVSHYPQIAEAIHQSVHDLGGSISAEHGIGRHKAHIIEKFKTPEEFATMRRIKAALDPNNIMNPGCLFPI